MIVMGIIGEATMAAMGAAYIVLSGLCVLPVLYLHRYANAIRQTELEKSAAFVESALLCQKSFWRVSGIITTITIGLHIAGIVVGTIVGVVMAAMTAPRRREPLALGSRRSLGSDAVVARASVRAM